MAFLSVPARFRLNGVLVTNRSGETFSSWFWSEEDAQTYCEQAASIYAAAKLVRRTEIEAERDLDASLQAWLRDLPPLPPPPAKPTAKPHAQTNEIRPFARAKIAA